MEDRLLPRKKLRRWPALVDANFYDVSTRKEFWLSGPKRDRADSRYGTALPQVDNDAREPTKPSLRVLRFRAANVDRAPSHLHSNVLSRDPRLCRCPRRRGASRTGRREVGDYLGWWRLIVGTQRIVQAADEVTEHLANRAT
jgi:hypothetical protein